MIVFSGTSKLAIQAAYSRVYLFVEGRGSRVEGSMSGGRGKDGGEGGGGDGIETSSGTSQFVFKNYNYNTLETNTTNRTRYLKKLIPKKSVVKKIKMS